jgi:putative DNA primase/helicase
MEFPARAYVLNPIIQTQSLTMIYSFRGIGKTYLAMSLGLAVASGGSVLKWSAPTPRKVVYVDGEMPGVSMRERLSAIIAGMTVEPPPGYFRIITPDLQPTGMPFPNLSGSIGQKMVEDELDGTELLILDNLSCLTRGVENDAESWIPMQEWALSLRRQGVSVLFLHHAGKAGAQRGTSKREDILDTVITLKRPSDYVPSEGSKFEVHFEKCRGIHGDETQPFETQLVMDAAGGMTWAVSNLEKIIAAKAMALFEAGMSVREVAEELKISKSTAHRIKGGN